MEGNTIFLQNMLRRRGPPTIFIPKNYFIKDLPEHDVG